MRGVGIALCVLAVISACSGKGESSYREESLLRHGRGCGSVSRGQRASSCLFHLKLGLNSFEKLNWELTPAEGYCDHVKLMLIGFRLLLINSYLGRNNSVLELFIYKLCFFIQSVLAVQFLDLGDLFINILCYG